MKHLPTIAGALLGLLFIAAGLTFLLGFIPEQPPPPEGSPMALFMDALVPTGYMTFVKVLEVLGGVLVALPRTRNLGLLVLGPIIINIAAFQVFILGDGLGEPMLLAIGALAGFLLWSERRAFAGLLAKNRGAAPLPE